MSGRIHDRPASSPAFGGQGLLSSRSHRGGIAGLLEVKELRLAHPGDRFQSSSDHFANRIWLFAKQPFRL
jgi:hypothetical protein